MDKFDDSAPAGRDEPVFDAVLYPHRSLSPTGFLILMLAIAGCSTAIGILFWIAGAWPVVGFLGLDVLLIYVAFRLSYRDARRYETLKLTASALSVERFVRGRRVLAEDLQPYWLNVLVEEERSGQNRLILRSHGRSLEVGAFLSPPEKSELADSLRAALAGLRPA
ncbi:MAG: DUF2244 domain-containing protein [Nisaea sp.]|jgi:uncharacterized membrane protein|uniref:DUF2244 domain-containing protein n=1 Tax=Nisaea sp. TaxID=2024842 RepID=UPI001B18F671|nr:DUF2244 domain-containing protein [Nisaea sp.]MBO6563047.1 DUF2244 domain-containing protein [Nisaea sp.]